MDKVKYLPHPCLDSEKREWNKKGYKVVDIKFAPPELEQAKPKAKKKAKAKA
tara:strand:- start:7 stop:162 length:156 start_codon:yes stop_codon:yes gene_type:complete